MSDSNKKSFFSFNIKNFKLWIMLAAIPVGAVLFVYLFGSSLIDDTAYREDDASLAAVKEENVTIREEKPDIYTHETGSMTLPDAEVRTPAGKMTTKDDKRMLGPNGSLETIEVEEGQSLQSLAQKKYGNKVFWVYFFDVNRDQLNNPDDVKVGMKLYLPNPEYFKFSAQDENSIQAAKKRATEILNSVNNQ